MTHSSNDQDLGVMASNLLASLNGLRHGFNQKVLVGIGNLTGQNLTLGVSQLPSPVLNCQGSPGVTSREAKCSNTAANVISEELKVEQEALSTGPAAQNLIPATLLLVTVGESDVDVLEGEVILGELLQTQNDGILRRILDPRSLLDERGTDLYYSELRAVQLKDQGDEVGANLGKFLVCPMLGRVRVANGEDIEHIPSKIRCVERSTVTSYPASINALQVVGVTACSSCE